MKLIVSGKQMEIGDALRTHVEEALTAVTEKHMRVNPTTATVTMHKERHIFHAAIHLHLSSGIDIHNHAEADDAYAAFDLARAQLEQSLTKYSKRINTYHTQQKASEAEHSSVAQQYILSEQFGAVEEEGDAADSPLIIAETTMKIDKMTVKDAVMRMELSGNPLVVFRNLESDVINVVYQRRDGNIGWVNPPKA